MACPSGSASAKGKPKLHFGIRREGGGEAASHARANGTQSEAIHPRKHHAPVGQYGGMRRLIGESQVFGRAPTTTFVGADALLNVQVGLSFVIVHPTESDHACIRRNRGALVPVEDARGGIAANQVRRGPCRGGVWNQHEARELLREGLVLEVNAPGRVNTPRLPVLGRGGFAIDFGVRFTELTGGQTILDTRAESGKGFAVETTDRFTLQIIGPSNPESGHFHAGLGY